MQKVEVNRVSTTGTGDFWPAPEISAHEPHSGALPGCATPRHSLSYHIFPRAANWTPLFCLPKGRENLPRYVI